MLNNEQKLNQAISFVRGLKKDLDNLYQNNKKLFEGRRELRDAFVDVFTKIDKSQQRLEHPVLSIATIGTTSAGKSTIVNALTGRTIAPMESQEMSAGVLRLIPNKDVSLEIARSPHWESGKFNPITDTDAKTKIENIFEGYRKFEKLTTPPDITVQGPLLWDSHPELLELPSNLSIEFVDLPGLKTLSDEKNLRVIQQHLSRSLCIVAMDYNDVGQDRVERLLEELEDIVKALSGNDDSILFLLNKVDARSQTDKPLPERIEVLKNLIKTRLPLKKNAEIKIIPFISRLLYYAQAAIGSSYHTDKEISIDVECIKKLKKDHTNTFINEDFASNEIQDFYTTTILTQKDVQLIPNNDVRQLIKHSYEVSHANELLAELKRRIQESFAAVIIQPAIFDTEKALNSLSAKLQTYVAINKSGNELELLTEQLGLAKKKFMLLGSASQENYNDLTKDMSNISSNLSKLDVGSEDDIVKVKKLLTNRISELKKEIEEKQPGKIDKRLGDLEENTTEIGKKLIEILQRNKDVQTEINNYLSQQKGKNSAFDVFSGLVDVPKLVKDKLNSQIIAVFRANLINNKGKGALEEELRKYLSAVLVTPLLSHYETIRSTFTAWQAASGYTQEGNFYVFKTKQELTPTNLSATKQMYESLNRRMRDVLSHKTNMLFQLEANNFATLLRKFIHSEFNGIISLLTESLGKTGIDLSKLIQTALEEKEPEIALPDKLFEFTAPSFDASTIYGSKLMPTGTRTVGSWCNERTETVYTTVADNTYQYKFPNANGIYESLYKGINTSETLFWVIITDWVNKTIKDYLSDIKLVSTNIITETNSMITARLAEKKEDVIAKAKIFDLILETVNKIETDRTNFKKVIL
jgi:hypothetical protein